MPTSHNAHALIGSASLESLPTAKHLQATLHEIQEWFEMEDVVKIAQKASRLVEAKKDGAHRLTTFYEGQVVLLDGVVGEIRGLEANSKVEINFLPYTMVAMVSSSTSIWKLDHGTKLRKGRRKDVTFVAWVVHDALATTIRVHIS